MIATKNEAPTALTVEASLTTSVRTKESNMNNVNTIQSLNHLVTTQDGALITTSINVAEAFGKLHKNVVRKLEMIECSQEFTELNFELSEYKDATGRNLPMYKMTKDGFMFLVMGFTGKKAAMIKEAYINAFNWMAKQLSGAAPKKTTTDERTSLRNAVNLLMAKKGLIYPDAYKIIHQRFNVDHLDQLEKCQLTEAVEYAHKLALDGEYLPSKPVNPPANQLQNNDITNINALCHHMVCLKNAFYQYKLAGVFEALGSRAGVDMVGHISDGFCVANNVRNIVLKFEQNGLPESIAPVM
ncbi:Rha family transcriptional regulator [Shewanella baltica]|uniref:Rha family transcriptional regulator n=1 Tax=Shewanella TaxID=22 RepID=UPI0009044191|nr:MULTISPECIES: Rha family transcriptional regulator [Shewanella]